MRRGCARGFTLIELLVVLAVVALLLAVAAPRYFTSIDKAKEVSLRQSLATMRDAIDKFHGDRGAYPETLEELVEKRYLRAVPVDPLTESATSWRIVPPPEQEKVKGRLYDIKSGADAQALDGSRVGDW